MSSNKISNGCNNEDRKNGDAEERAQWPHDTWPFRQKTWTPLSHSEEEEGDAISL